MSSLTSKSTASSSSDDDSTLELRRGPWTVEEDRLLMHYVSCHGDGRWNSTAKCSGLRRTGKSCRLRWLNYLKPDVKRGNLTPQEQLMILELHSKWGNRWSKIAQHLPGRTDNEIKNYWRTRVLKQARHLKIDSNSSAFQEIIQRLWVPHLLQKIQGYLPPTTSATTTTTNHQSDPNHVAQQQVDQEISQAGSLHHNHANSSRSEQFTECHLSQSIHLPAQVPRVSECTITSPFHRTNDNTMVNCETPGGNVEKFVNDPAILDDWFMLANTWVHDETEDSLWSMDDLWQLQ